MTKRRLPKVVNIEELKNKKTKELLGYLSRLQKCEESFELSDMDDNIDLSDYKTIYFKQTQKWKEAYKNVKTVLDKREHVKK